MTRKKLWESNVLVGAATVHDGQFLLLRRSGTETFLPDLWGIPAGKTHWGEDPSAACIRELHEETGLQGQIADLVGYSTFMSKRGDVELSNVQLNFLVHVQHNDVKLDPASHSEFRWIPLDDRDNDLLDPFTKDIMISALQYYEISAGRVAHG
jgi:8-oxo-dGTP pyrophosphatase MutT (NUDIX family)